MDKDLEVRTTCPLGSECQEIKTDPVTKKGYIARCKWYIKMEGVHPTSGEKIENWDCAQNWAPILLITNAREQHSTAAGIESFRNEMVKANESSQQLLLAAAQATQGRPALAVYTGGQRQDDPPLVLDQQTY